MSEPTTHIDTHALATIPERNSNFVAFGDFPTIKHVIESRQFLPIYITGLSGNGKTFQVEQACALTGREYVRVNITPETDEDDLIGGFRLINGETVFEWGPVPIAMTRGAILLFDEMDYAFTKIACVQSVLEGKSVTIKKISKKITPAPGFNVIATCNTKGRGDDTGKFVGASLLNESFLERFPMTIEQSYPPLKTEMSILTKMGKSLGIPATENSKIFYKTLAKWSDAIRTLYNENGIDDTMSTRRLCQIIHVYSVLKNDTAALKFCTARFEQKTQLAMMELYNRLLPEPIAVSEPVSVSVTPETENNDIPF